MLQKITILIVTLLSTAKSEDVTIAKKFEQEEIVSDILRIGPASELCLEYSGSHLVPGSILTPEETSTAPLNVKWNSNPEKTYTLLMLDPDAISRKKPIFRSVLHWLVVNIPGNAISEGDVKAKYGGPGPPKGTGLHRYVFLVWEQTANIQHPEFVTLPSRAKFSMTDFAAKYKLVEVPVAGNYFQAENK